MCRANEVKEVGHTSGKVAMSLVAGNEVAYEGCSDLKSTFDSDDDGNGVVWAQS